MNRTILLMTYKQFLNRPVRMFVLFCVGMLPLVLNVMTRHVYHTKHLDDGMPVQLTGWFVMIVAAGVIGLDVSDGILPLIFSRPLKRYEYVLSKWFAVSSIATLCVAVALCVQLVLNYGLSPALLEHIALTDFLQGMVLAFGTSAVVTLLSALLPGSADIGIILLFSVIIFILSVMQETLHIPGMTEVGRKLTELLYPSFTLDEISGWRDLLTLPVGQYFLVTILSLTGATAILNQKELTYGSN